MLYISIEANIRKGGADEEDFWDVLTYTFHKPLRTRWNFLEDFFLNTSPLLLFQLLG